MTNKEVGTLGENLAKDYLIKNGHKIIETNKHFSRFCEIDIIAKDKNTIVFVEVKTRSSNLCGSPLEAITKRKYDNIKTGVFTYLQEKNLTNQKFRIDAISIILKPEVKIQHLKNIFL